MQTLCVMLQAIFTILQEVCVHLQMLSGILRLWRRLLQDLHELYRLYSGCLASLWATTDAAQVSADSAHAIVESIQTAVTFMWDVAVSARSEHALCGM